MKDMLGMKNYSKEVIVTVVNGQTDIFQKNVPERQMRDQRLATL